MTLSNSKICKIQDCHWLDLNQKYFRTTQNTLVTAEFTGERIGGKCARCSRFRWRRQKPFSSHCMVSHRVHPWSLPVSHSSSRRRKVLKSTLSVQHQPTSSYTCCGPMCRSCCRKRQTSEPHTTSQPISLSSVRSSAMASQFLLLLRLIHHTCVM